MTPDWMKRLEQLATTPPWEWPPDAAESIKVGLASSDEAVRRSSVGLAGDLVVMDDELAARLLALVVDDGPEELRGMAATAFAPALEEAGIVGFDTELDPDFDRPALSRRLFDEVRRALRAICEDPQQPPSVRRRCLEASVRVPDSWHSSAVRAALGASDTEWRATALTCMGWLRGFDAEILAGLDAAEPELRRAAVQSASRMELEEAGPRVLELARDEHGDRELRLLSVDALGTLYPPGSHALLVELSSSDDEELSGIARQALSELRAFSMAPPG